jgi:outer membrane lipoprotein SlyB
MLQLGDQTDQLRSESVVHSSQQACQGCAHAPPGHDTAVLAITGAVLGALIGGPHHAGQGALIGAGSGAVVGAASDISRQQYAQQLQEAYANRDQALDPRYEGKAGKFRRAMSA